MKTAAVLMGTILMLTGCASSDSDGPAPASASPADPSRPPGHERLAGTVAVEMVIKDGKVSPQGGRAEVEVGDTVTLRITSDADEEIHVHSEPEHTYEVEAGRSITTSFVISRPGQVAVEAHHLGVTIVQLVVRP